MTNDMDRALLALNDEFISDNIPAFNAALTRAMRGDVLAKAPASEAADFLAGYVYPHKRLGQWSTRECGENLTKLIASLEAERVAAALTAPVKAIDVLRGFMKKLNAHFALERSEAACAHIESITQLKTQPPEEYWTSFRQVIALNLPAHPAELVIGKGIAGMHPVYDHLRKKLQAEDRSTWPDRLDDIIKEQENFYKNVVRREIASASTASRASRGRSQSPGRDKSASSDRYYCALHGNNVSHDTDDCRQLEEMRLKDKAPPPRQVHFTAIEDEPVLDQLAVKIARTMLEQQQQLQQRLAFATQASTSGRSHEHANSSSTGHHDPRGGMHGRGHNPDHGNRGNSSGRGHNGGRNGGGRGQPNGRGFAGRGGDSQHTCPTCGNNHEEKHCWLLHPHQAPPNWVPKLVAHQWYYKAAKQNMQQQQQQPPTGTTPTHRAATLAALHPYEDPYDAGDPHPYTFMAFTDSPDQPANPLLTGDTTASMLLLPSRPESLEGEASMSHSNDESPTPKTMIAGVALGNEAMPSASSSAQAWTWDGIIGLPESFNLGDDQLEELRSSVMKDLERILSKRDENKQSYGLALLEESPCHSSSVPAASIAAATVVRPHPPVPFVPAQLKQGVYPPQTTAAPPSPQATVGLSLSHPMQSDTAVVSLSTGPLALVQSLRKVEDLVKDGERIKALVLLGHIRNLHDGHASKPPPSSPAGPSTVAPLVALSTALADHATLYRTPNGAEYTVSGFGPPPVNLLSMPVKEAQMLVSKSPDAIRFMRNAARLHWFPDSTVAISVGGRQIALRRVLLDKGANVTLFTDESAREHGLEWVPTDQMLSTSGPNIHVVGKLIVQGKSFVLLPGTKHEVVIPLQMALVVKAGHRLFDVLVGNEQMHTMADCVASYPRARVMITPNVLTNPEYVISIYLQQTASRPPASAYATALVAATAAPAKAVGSEDVESEGLGSEDDYPSINEACTDPEDEMDPDPHQPSRVMWYDIKGFTMQTDAHPSRQARVQLWPTGGVHDFVIVEFMNHQGDSNTPTFTSPIHTRLRVHQVVLDELQSCMQDFVYEPAGLYAQPGLIRYIQLGGGGQTKADQEMGGPYDPPDLTSLSCGPHVVQVMRFETTLAAQQSTVNVAVTPRDMQVGITLPSGFKLTLNASNGDVSKTHLGVDLALGLAKAADTYLTVQCSNGSFMYKHPLPSPYASMPPRPGHILEDYPNLLAYAGPLVISKPGLRLESNRKGMHMTLNLPGIAETLQLTTGQSSHYAWQPNGRSYIGSHLAQLKTHVPSITHTPGSWGALSRLVVVKDYPPYKVLVEVDFYNVSVCVEEPQTGFTYLHYGLRTKAGPMPASKSEAARIAFGVPYLEWEAGSADQRRIIHQYVDKELMAIHRIPEITSSSFTSASTVTYAMLAPSSPSDMEVTMPVPQATLHTAVAVPASSKEASSSSSQADPGQPQSTDTVWYDVKGFTLRTNAHDTRYACIDLWYSNETTSLLIVNFVGLEQPSPGFTMTAHTRFRVQQALLEEMQSCMQDVIVVPTRSHAQAGLLHYTQQGLVLDPLEQDLRGRFEVPFVSKLDMESPIQVGHFETSLEAGRCSVKITIGPYNMKVFIILPSGLELALTASTYRPLTRLSNRTAHSLALAADTYLTVQADVGVFSQFLLGNPPQEPYPYPRPQAKAGPLVFNRPGLSWNSNQQGTLISLGLPGVAKPLILITNQPSYYRQACSTQEAGSSQITNRLLDLTSDPPYGASNRNRDTVHRLVVVQDYHPYRVMVETCSFWINARIEVSGSGCSYTLQGYRVTAIPILAKKSLATRIGSGIAYLEWEPASYPGKEREIYQYADRELLRVHRIAATATGTSAVTTVTSAMLAPSTPADLEVSMPVPHAFLHTAVSVPASVGGMAVQEVDEDSDSGSQCASSAPTSTSTSETPMQTAPLFVQVTTFHKIFTSSDGLICNVLYGADRLDVDIRAPDTYHLQFVTDMDHRPVVPLSTAEALGNNSYINSSPLPFSAVWEEPTYDSSMPSLSSASTSSSVTSASVASSSSLTVGTQTPARRAWMARPSLSPWEALRRFIVLMCLLVVERLAPGVLAVQDATATAVEACAASPLEGWQLLLIIIGMLGLSYLKIRLMIMLVHKLISIGISWVKHLERALESWRRIRPRPYKPPRHFKAYPPVTSTPRRHAVHMREGRVQVKDKGDIIAKRSTLVMHDGHVTADSCTLEVQMGNLNLQHSVADIRNSTYVDANCSTINTRCSTIYAVGCRIVTAPEEGLKSTHVTPSSSPATAQHTAVPTAAANRLRNPFVAIWLWISALFALGLPTTSAYTVVPQMLRLGGPPTTYSPPAGPATPVERVYLAIIALALGWFLHLTCIKIHIFLRLIRMRMQMHTSKPSRAYYAPVADPWVWPIRAIKPGHSQRVRETRDKAASLLQRYKPSTSSASTNHSPPGQAPIHTADSCASDPAGETQGGEDSAGDSASEQDPPSVKALSLANRFLNFLVLLVTTATSRRQWSMPRARQGRRLAIREFAKKRSSTVLICKHTAWTRQRLVALLLLTTCMVGGAACTGIASTTLVPPEAMQGTAAMLALGGYVMTHKASFSTFANSGISCIHPDGEGSLVPSERYTKDPNHGWVWGNAKGMDPEQQERLQSTVLERKSAFAFNMAEITGYTGDLGPFRIDLDTTDPIYQSPRRRSEAEREVAKEKTEELLAPGIVVPCTAGAQYACNSVIAAKKDAVTGMWTDKRMAQDYRRINDRTPPDKYGLHRPEDIFQRVGKAKFFTKLDMRQGFLQIPILPEHQSRTAYWLDNQLMMYTRMPYGLKNAPAWFQRVMDYEISKAGLDHCAVAFIDDLLIYSDTAEEHIKQVASVLDMLEACGLRAHNSKSLIGCDAVEYLGHNISFYGMHPHEAKVAAIRELKAPSNVSELRALLGFVNYYRCYVPNFSAMACPLNMLLRKDVPWLWGPDQHIALEAMKQALTTEGLALKRIDYSKPLILHTDWSALGMGAVLGQKDEDGNEYMCACISRSLNKHERNYSSYKGEMLGAVWAVKTFRHHLHGNKFLLITDHSPLTYLMSNPNLTGQYARWALALQEFDFQVEHRPGVKHQNADVLSRFPRASTADYTGARLDHDSAPIEAESSIRLAAFTRTRAKLDFQLMQAYMSNALHGFSWIDDHCPTPSGLLAGHNGVITDPLDVPPEPDDSIVSKRQERLNLRANAWVHAAKGRMKAIKPAPSIPLQVEQDASGHVTACTSLNTSILPKTAMNDMLNNGVFLYEPFGGLCAGLEMCLRNGIRVRRYAYSDSSHVARKVAMHRMQALSAAYPTLLPPEAFQDALLILPHDVTTVTHHHLQKLALLHPYQWMVVAGWPCQDLSAAGPGTGLDGSRSRTFFDLLRILGTLQTLMPDKPPAYILENAAMQLHRDPFIHQHEFGRICAAIGQPVLLDAAQFGAYAHRLRNFWLNIGCTSDIGAIYHGIQRDPKRVVQDILEPYHEPKIAKGNNPLPYCQCNVVGETLRALPTLVTFQHSHAFRDDGPGMLFNKINGIYEEPNAEERERALGYETGSTAAPGLTAADRHSLTGNAMDATCVESLLAISLAIHRHKYGIQAAHFVAAATMISHAPKGIAMGLAALSTAVVNVSNPGDQSMLAELAELQDTHAQPSDSPDIWEDATTMHYLCTHEHEPGLAANEQRRITKRARQYSYQSGKLYRLMADGTKREVPKQIDRLALVKSMHEDTGHFGERRTTALLQTSYWWTGMRRDAKAVVKHCKVCDRIKASFNHSQPQLNPLPIVGLFYRWGVDLAGPFEETPRGHKYVMVCIEHFSKYAVFIPLKDKTADCTTFAFMHNVLGRYGACAELVSDQGGEWKAAFTELLAQSLIDHRFTSPNHPQANGLSERAVQTCKRALRKLAEDSGTRDSWDIHLPYVMLGYNCSTQESTKMSPYQLMHSIAPIVPPAIKERFDSPLALDGDEAVEAAAESVRVRAAALQRNLAIAGENLMAAQHRDTLRYATIRGGGYHPRLRRFEAGDYVYHRNTTHAKNLELKARPEILRVKEVRPSGVLVLQGRCGGTITVHAIHCAPCHLLISTHDINIHLGRPSATHACEVCKYTDDEHVMLLCDSCNSGWHTFCLTPQLEAVPPGRWICPTCDKSGVTLDTVTKAMAEAEALQTRQGPMDIPALASDSIPPGMLPFHNRTIMQPFVDPSGKSRLYRGTTEYAGKQGNTHYFNICYEDGDIETVTYSKIKLMLDDSEAAPPVPSRAAMKQPPTQVPVEVKKAVTFQTSATSKAAATTKQSATPAKVSQHLSSAAGPSTRSRSRTAAVAHRYIYEDDFDSNFESGVCRNDFNPLRNPPPNRSTPWSLTDKEGLGKIISHHMRGEYEGEDLETLAAAIKLGPPAHAVGFNLGDADRYVAPLLRVFNLSNSVDIYDPMPGQGGIEHFFKRQGYPTRRTGLATTQHSPLLPQHYADLCSTGFVLDTVVCRPWAATLDIFLPLVAQHVRTVACVYVPASYILDAPPHRLGWLRRMQGFGCLYIMIGVPDLGGGNSAMWICVGKREAFSHRMVKGFGRHARLEIA